MVTFMLSPDFSVLNRYLTSTSDVDFDTANPNYQIAQMEYPFEWGVITNAAEFSSAFKDLLSKHAIEGHYDNLLYLVLHRFDVEWTVIQHFYDDYESKKRARQLAQLLILLKETKPGKLNNVTFKPYMGTAKVDDTILNQWISDTLIKAIEQKQYPFGQFGLAVMQMLTGDKGTLTPEAIDTDRLKIVINKRLVHPKNKIRKGQFNLCIFILSYLDGETTFRAEEGVMFSDAQLIFLFELLVLLKQVDENDFESEPKDFMRALMSNFI
jgi:hypothetical protein